MEVSCNYSRRNIKIKLIAIVVLFTISIFGIVNINYARLDPGGGVNSSSGSSSGSSGGTTSGGSVQSDLGDLNSYVGTPSGSQRINEIAGIIVGVIRTVGIVLSVAILIVIGIKYMMGSVEEKADYKQSLKPYIIGAFLLFTGSLVPQLIYTLSQNFN